MAPASVYVILSLSEEWFVEGREGVNDATLLVFDAWGLRTLIGRLFLVPPLSSCRCTAREIGVNDFYNNTPFYFIPSHDEPWPLF